MRTFLIVLFFSLNGSLISQVTWTAFENLNDSLRNQKKSLLIFIHTDWCKFCKLQENITFTDSNVVAITKGFYCLRLNAEDKTDMTFLNRIYTFKPTGINTGQHQLANYLAKEKGMVSYPTTVIFNTNLEIVKRLVGFYNKEDMMKAIIKCF